MADQHVHFYDDRAVQAAIDLDLVYGPVEKIGQVLGPDRPSDLERIYSFAGSAVPLDRGGWRLYYSAVGGGPRAHRIAVAESPDGLHWAKPDLGQLQWDGADTNHLRFEGLSEDDNRTQPQVVRLDDGRWRLYFWWHAHDRGMCRYIAADSDDGLHFEVVSLDRPCVFHPSDCEVGQAGWVAGLTAADPNDKFAHQRTLDYLAAKRLRSNDATFVYRHPRTGQFEMYSVWLMPNDEGTGCHVPFDNAPMVRRTLHRRTSDDGLNWSDPELILVPDEHDPRHMQFYHLGVHYEGDWLVGFLGHYRCWEQTMDLELCFSRDGRRWHRPLRGAWIPRGAVDDVDYMSVYPVDRLIDRDGRLLMLYTGGNMKHNGELPPGVDTKRHAIMGAWCPAHRFAGLATRPRCVGSLVLRPFILVSQTVRLDANIRGTVRAELRDPYGRPMEGYRLADSVALTGDSADHELRWQNGATTAPYQHDAVSLRLELQDATLYRINI